MLYLWPLFFIFTLTGPGLAAADPVTNRLGSSEQSDLCDDHNTVHKRLDTIQEQVEKTVDHLDSEVKSLLKAIGETWSAPLSPGTPLVDLFGDTS